jgi:CHASE3 domain sensor protein
MGAQTNGSIGRWLIAAGFVIACAVLAGLIGGSLWQSSVSDSKTEDAEAYTARATLLEEAGAEGQAAAQGLQSFVETGDTALLPQIEEHSTVGVEKLTTALSQEGVSDVGGILSAASDLVDGATQVVTLRQSGDVPAAAAALEAMSAEFNALIETQTAAIDAEHAAAEAAQSDADSAESAASSLLYSGIGLGVLIVVSGLFILGRAVFGGRTAERESMI